MRRPVSSREHRGRRLARAVFTRAGRKWAKVARQFGWVVCPSGPGQSETGGRTWVNGALEAQKIIDATVHALREKYHGRVRRRSNILIGFSEGAFVAMNVGMRDQA